MPGNRNEGEGSRSAARAYNEAAQAHKKGHDVEAEAQEARDALKGKEGNALRDAERTGKDRAKEEDPSIKRDR